MENKIIGIDARLYGPLSKGLGRYTKEVIDRIIKKDLKNKYVVFLNDENFDDFDIVQENVEKVVLNVRWYTLAEQIILPFYIWKKKIDLMHFPHFNVPLFVPCKYIVTIHDLILTKFPSQRASTLSPFLYKLKNFAYKIVIKNAIKKSQKIIAVSNFTKNDIIEQFKANENKIVVIYEGITKTIDNLKFDKKILDEYKIKKDYLMYVGNAYPHKNLEKLIEVFVKIKKTKSNLCLVLVGGENYFYKRLKKYVLNFDKTVWDDILFTGYVSDNKLAVLFKFASVYVFPSKYEGFGLPPLESMVFGCPVASSNQSCLPEILGKAALYFDPYDLENMKEKILEILDNKDLRKILIKNGYEQIKKYDWDDCAKKTKLVYNVN